jgi:hypothetical protein
MNIALLKVLGALLPVSLLLFGSVLLFLREKGAFRLFQAIGAGAMLLGVLTHLFEVSRMFPATQWGRQHSAGHYLDFCGAVAALTLFPAGYLLQALTKTTRVKTSNSAGGNARATLFQLLQHGAAAFANCGVALVFSHAG